MTTHCRIHAMFARAGRRILVALVLSLADIPIAAAGPLTLPGPADAARVMLPPKPLPAVESAPDEEEEEEGLSALDVPPALLRVPVPPTRQFVLKRVEIEGVTLFSHTALKDIYAPYLNQKISSEIGWMMTGMLQERYRHAGHNPARAYLKPPSIKSGVITIKVIENRAPCTASSPACPLPSSFPL